MAAEETINFRITVEGGDNTARTFDRIAGSQKAANDQFKTLSVTAARSAQTLGALGNSLSRLDPQFGALGQSIGRASGAIMSMTTVLGGPWGIAVGAAVAALGLFSSAQEEQRKKTEEATEALKKQARTFQDLATAGKSFFGGMRKGSTFMATGMDPATMSGDELRDLQRSLQAQLDVHGTGLKGGNTLRKRDRERIKAQLAEVEDALGVSGLLLPGEAPGGVQGSAAGKDSKKKVERRATFDELERRAQVDRQLASLDQMGRGQTVDQMMEGANRAQGKAENGLARNDLDAKRSAFDKEVDEYRERADKLHEIDREYQEKNAALEAEAHARRQRYQSVAIEGAQSLERVSISGMQKIAKGQKFTVRELLSGVGDEMVAGGTKWIMEGTGRLIASYGTDPSGWGLIGLGGAEVAFGLGLGAATRAGGAGAGGGGRRERPMSPMGGGGGGPSEPQHITINMPTVVSPGPQDGVRVQQALDEARRSGLVRAA